MSRNEIIGHYSRTGYEDQRLASSTGRLEFIRSKDIIARHIGEGKKKIADIGGATGAYSFWLTSLGHEVHLADLVPAHIELAQEKNRVAEHKLASLQVADACDLPFEDNSMDIVLLMGPLYHIINRSERIKALSEAGRVIKPGGPVLCAVISRFASVLDGIRAGYVADPEFEGIVERDLKTGTHINDTGNDDYFTTAYFHTPNELREEIAESGLACEKLLGIEGPWCVKPEIEKWLDKEQNREIILKYARLLEEEVSLLGSSFHIMGISRK